MIRTLPEPRPGLAGHWDRFVGPGMTRGETLLVLGASVIGTALVILHHATLGLAWWQIILGAVIAFDVIGGAVCNCTDTTRRWYHRAGRSVRDHFAFIALHLFHIAIVAWAFRGAAVDLVYFGVIGGWLCLSALAVLSAPWLLRNPLSVALYLVAIALMFYVIGPTPGLEWFIPALFVKLLIGHAVGPVPDA